MSLLKELKRIEKEDMRNLLLFGNWESLDIDYHPPHVERVWTKVGENRLSLHLIHPCDKGESLLHPHPWKSAMHVIKFHKFRYPTSGRYEHGIGYNNGEEDIMLSKQVYKGDVYYEIDNPETLHYVRPIGGPCYSIMLNGPVEWEQNNIPANKKLKPLSKKRKAYVLDIFKELYL